MRRPISVSADGLIIKNNGSSNRIGIDDGNRFTNCQIIIDGENNIVHLSKNRVFKNLFIHVKGNNKTIVIDKGERNIVNLKITSTRGNNQRVAIGKNFSCGGLDIQMNDGDESCSIGDDCLFSWGIKLRTSDGHSIVDLATNKAINLPEDVIISDRVWCGEDVKFLKGCTIAYDSVVGSGSVVSKKFTQPNIIVAGSPARIVKENIKWDRSMPSVFNSTL